MADDNDLTMAKMSGNKLRIKVESVCKILLDIGTGRIFRTQHFARAPGKLCPKCGCARSVVANAGGAMLTSITVKAVYEEIKSIQDRLAYVAAILDNAELTCVHTTSVRVKANGVDIHGEALDILYPSVPRQYAQDGRHAYGSARQGICPVLHVRHRYVHDHLGTWCHDDDIHEPGNNALPLVADQLIGTKPQHVLEGSSAATAPPSAPPADGTQVCVRRTHGMHVALPSCSLCYQRMSP